jgi:predicted DNA-binding transcriptional regulator AlpA
MPKQDTNPAQARFDTGYITSSEIMSYLGVSRTTMLVARRTGKLPNPICIAGSLYIWERTPTLTAFLTAWHTMATNRRTRNGAVA